MLKLQQRNFGDLTFQSTKPTTSLTLCLLPQPHHAPCPGLALVLTWGRIRHLLGTVEVWPPEIPTDATWSMTLGPSTQRSVLQGPGGQEVQVDSHRPPPRDAPLLSFGAPGVQGSCPSHSPSVLAPTHLWVLPRWALHTCDAVCFPLLCLL